MDLDEQDEGGRAMWEGKVGPLVSDWPDCVLLEWISPHHLRLCILESSRPENSVANSELHSPQPVRLCCCVQSGYLFPVQSEAAPFGLPK